MPTTPQFSREIIKDSFDIHVHADPSLFPRWGDAWDLASECLNAGMAGFVLKLHQGSSVEVAAILDRQFSDLNVIGGLTLNHYIGGLNPAAVDSALSLGAKLIWLPTVHAANHGAVFGCLGTFNFQESSNRLQEVQGISILDEKGELVSNLKEILTLLDGQPSVLATGHVSEEEIVLLHRYIRSNRLDIRFLVNHFEFKVSDLSLDTLKEMNDDLTWFETAYFSISKMGGSTTAEDVAQKILAIPEAKWIMASDSGQKENLKSPDALAEFAGLLMQRGLTQQQIERMLVIEPRNLLI